MTASRLKRAFVSFLSMMLALQLVLPNVALAAQREVELDNHTMETDQTSQISDIYIDDVDGPKTGTQLDDEAVVTTAEKNTWDIPVLWVRDDMQVDRDAADDGHDYLPALAFFVPQEYALNDDTFTVTLSETLTELFGSEETISVYDASTDITYILPASIKGIFANASTNGKGKTIADAKIDVNAKTDADTGSVSPAQPAPQTPSQEESKKSLVDIYCAKSAREALSDEDLEWLINLIIERLQPQAVQTLINSFPAFAKYAKTGDIGKEIGLYIYYKKGDDDGDVFHKTIKGALAYVLGGAQMKNGTAKYSYMLAVNVKSLLKKNIIGDTVKDPSTGKYVLVREGKAMIELQNTLVHETLHAFMDDFNRTGMVGATNLRDVIESEIPKSKMQEYNERYAALKFPKWFIEGTASAVENVYQYRYDLFQVLRRAQGDKGYGTGKLNDSFTAQDVLNNYIFAKYSNGEKVWFDIGMSDAIKDANGDEVDTSASRYVTGYLATLYLCNLAAIKVEGKSAVQVKNGITTVDADLLSTGYDTLLHTLHYGRSLDEAILRLSPKDANGNPLYKSTNDFTAKFIKGPLDGDTFHTDKGSMDFVLAFLNYMLYIDNKLGDNKHPNGSILFPFDKYYNTVLDANKKVNSDYYHIVKSNTGVESTVKPTEAKIGGGMSDPDKGAKTQSSDKSAEELPAAAKADEPAVTEQEATVVEPATAPEPVAAPEATPAPEVATEPAPTPEPETVPEATPEPTPAPAAEPAPAPEPTPEATPEPEPAPAAETPAETPADPAAA